MCDVMLNGCPRDLQVLQSASATTMVALKSYLSINSWLQRSSFTLGIKDNPYCFPWGVCSRPADLGAGIQVPVSIAHCRAEKDRKDPVTIEGGQSRVLLAKIRVLVRTRIGLYG